MKERSFIDTNVLVYADDADSPEKSAIAVDIIEASLRSNRGVLSTQVLQEYFSAATRKLGVEIGVARRRIQLLTRLQTLQVSPADVLSAIDLVQLHQLSFWDALIVHAARRANCTVLLTEDMNHGQTIDGIRIHNPFN